MTKELSKGTRKFEVLLSAMLRLTSVGGAIRHDDLECVDVQFNVIGRDVE